MMRKIDFLGFAFDDVDAAQTAELLNSRPGPAPFVYVVTPNVDHVARLQKVANAEQMLALHGAWLTVNDSNILRLLAKMCGINLPTVPGSDLTAAVIRTMVKPGDTVTLIGGDAAMAGALAATIPGATLLHHGPPMGVLRNEHALAAAVAFVVEHPARFVLLAIGAPQQEVIARRILLTGQASGIGLCIGASVEFVTGRKARAPTWVRRLNLEWLHRLLSEPRRLWRRYLIEGPRIFLIVWRWRKSRANVM